MPLVGDRVSLASVNTQKLPLCRELWFFSRNYSSMYIYIYTIHACVRGPRCRGDRCPEARSVCECDTVSHSQSHTVSLSSLAQIYIIFFSRPLYILSQIWHLLSSRKTQYLGEPRRQEHVTFMAEAGGRDPAPEPAQMYGQRRAAAGFAGADIPHRSS